MISNFLISDIFLSIDLNKYQCRNGLTDQCRETPSFRPMMASQTLIQERSKILDYEKYLIKVRSDNDELGALGEVEGVL